MRGIVGGRYYWGRKIEENDSNSNSSSSSSSSSKRREGVVVVFAWMSSEDRHVRSYVDLYSSLGWDSLVCHSLFLNMFFPHKAEALAFDLLTQLVQDLKIRPCPVVLASFSGGPKACMYKVLQILEGTCKLQLNADDCRLVKDCIAGHIYDSSPVDFTSDLGRRFVVHPSVLKMSRPPRILSWMANGISDGLDALFLSRFEADRADYWQTLYSSVNMRAPYLVVCSESDGLAPFQIIHNFTRRLQELGADVKLVMMVGSHHVGHYRKYPIEYKAAVTELLAKAAGVYSQRIRGLEGEKLGSEGTHDGISGVLPELRKAAASPNRSFWGANISPSDHVGYYEGRDVGSLQDEYKEGLIHLPNPPSINTHGVLGQILFDVCVPKDVEDWDLKSSTSLSRHPYTYTYSSPRRHAPFNPIKCIRRSRL